MSAAESQQMELSGVPEKPEDQADALVVLIDRFARDPSVDVDKMERLLAMQERVFEKRAEVAFNQAMAEVQAAGVKIRRDRKNSQTGSMYATLEAISGALTPIITDHGFSLSYGTDKADIDGWIRITGLLAHVGGHSRSYHVDLPLDTAGIKDRRNKTDIHGAGSAITYGRRYLKLLIFDVATPDDDGNAGGGNVVTFIEEEQAIELREWIESLERDEAKFCEALGIPNLEAMPVELLGKAKNLLKKAERAK
jgi:hypothetical protein